MKLVIGWLSRDRYDDDEGMDTCIEYSDWKFSKEEPYNYGQKKRIAYFEIDEDE